MVSELAAASGYASPAYARSLADLGQPRALVASGGWLLERPVAETAYRDAMGCYPLFACADWSQLHHDLEGLSGALVSLVLVADPFGGFRPEDLRRCFPDLLTPFKQHFVVDLHSPLRMSASAHHRRNARKALRAVAVEHDVLATELSEEWMGLYERLIARHDIRGPAAFSSAALASQLAVPGLVALRARRGAETVGMMLWYVQGDVGYYHLAAYSDEGYRQRASFALFSRAIEVFAQRGLRWLNLGAGAGPEANLDDGLTRFKAGWATGTRTAYLCGRICDPDAYAALSAAAGPPAGAWFPAYRAAERGRTIPETQP